MKKVLGLGFLAIVSLALFLAIQTPAVFIWQQVKSYLPSQVRSIQLQGLSGTLWKGSAQSVTVNGRKLPKLSWELADLSPVSQVVSYDFKLGHSRSGLSASGLLSMNPEEITLLDAKGRINGQALKKWAGRAPVDIAGQIQVQVDELRLSKGQCLEMEGSGQLKNIIADSQAGELKLGQGNLDLDCANGLLLARLQQKSSDLESSLVLSLLNSSRYRIKGTVTPGTGLEPAMKKGLGFFGRANGQGGYEVNYKGRM